MSWPLWAVAVSTVPLVLLAVMVLRSMPVTRSAWIAVGVAGVLALAVFGLDLGELAVAMLRGTWTGTWILLIVLPSLFLYEILDRSGALEQLAQASDQIAPTEGRRLLLIAWVFPSFLQGVAGFGAPIAMSAPLLVRRGMPPVAAVAACMIGYQWSVTFGSMGSSYFMAEATARLAEPDARVFATRTAITLGITAIVSGLIVLTRGVRSAGDTWRALVIGVIMAATLFVVVSVQPALGSTAAGLVGLGVCWWLLPARGQPRPGGGDLGVAALPYIVLSVAAVTGLWFPPVRSLFERVPAFAPVLPGVEAAFGYQQAASAVTPTFRPLLHPFVYMLLAIAVGLVVYRRKGWWDASKTQQAARSWAKRSANVARSIIGLTVLAAILTDAGMVSALAQALAATLGIGFVAVSAPLGAFGTILTGSTTASNALFSALQSQVASVLALLPAVLLVGQTSGGNIGNALAPGVATVGLASTGATTQEGAVIRHNLGSATILMVIATLLVVAQVWMLRA
ncbi:MAG: L-lactate permease [Nitriliruptoraceae bacterium]